LKNKWIIRPITFFFLFFYLLIIQNQEILKNSIRLLRYPDLIRIWNHLIRKNLIRSDSDQIGFKISVRSIIIFRTLLWMNYGHTWDTRKCVWVLSTFRSKSNLWSFYWIRCSETHIKSLGWWNCFKIKHQIVKKEVAARVGKNGCIKRMFTRLFVFIFMFLSLCLQRLKWV